MEITGTVAYINIGPGCWGIIDSKGRQYRPINFPPQLKTIGKQVTVSANKVTEEFSVFMWGEPVKVTSFST